MRNIIIFMFISISLTFTACKKCKNECLSSNIAVKPFVEKFYTFTCGGNLYEYQYIFRKKEQIDSLSDCNFSPSVAFPVHEGDMVYIMVGRFGYYRGDTMQTTLYKDTCLKTLTYDVSTIQRDTIRTSFYPILGARSMFCSVENIPADYTVEVKYKYVPIQ